MLIKYEGNNLSINENDISIVKPITIRVNDIEEDKSKDFFDRFEEAENTGQNIIPIIIDSYGGDIYSLFAMIDCIKESKKIVMTICSGKACSAGAILLSCGHEGYRYITPNSSVMIHDVSSVLMGKADEMGASMKEVNRVNAQLYKILDENCGQKPGYFKEKIKKLKNVDFWLTPEKALEFNLINHIAVPNLTYKIDYNFLLNV